MNPWLLFFVWPAVVVVVLSVALLAILGGILGAVILSALLIIAWPIVPIIMILEDEKVHELY